LIQENTLKFACPPIQRAVKLVRIAMSVAARTQMTLQDYVNYDDGTEIQYELVDGVLVEMPVESWDASTISIYLLTQFLAFVPYYLLRHKDTEVAVSSRSAKARIPDLMVVTEATSIEMMGQKGLVPIGTAAPLLIVEVVSPGQPGEPNYDRDYVEKRAEYAARGIAEYWLVDPGHGAVLILSLDQGSYRVKVFCGADRLQSLVFPPLNLTAASVLKAGR
jgi:Uma2 family endonuclease